MIRFLWVMLWDHILGAWYSRLCFLLVHVRLYGISSLWFMFCDTLLRAWGVYSGQVSTIWDDGSLIF